MARMILETVRLGSEGVRCFVKADDDTLIFVDNLVEVLAKYDHNGYYYIGGNSECIVHNDQHSFNMAFGGAGFAVSDPLAKVLARNLDGCIKIYQTFYGEDHLIQFCMAELGVSFTRESGFHQIQIKTFQPWNRKARPPFVFNVGQRSSNSCVNPHIFYLEFVEFADLNQIVTSYIGRTPWRPSFCGNHSVESVSKIKVYTTATGL